MQEEEIQDTVSIQLRKRMEHVWDITQSYWYPLSHCDREDLIAFNFEFIESEDKLKSIISLLKEHGVEQVIEFLETGQTYIKDISALYPYYCYNADFIGGEGFWTSRKMDWIIYASHEGTITFGGEWLVKRLKLLWPDWKFNIEWDTKN